MSLTVKNLKKSFSGEVLFDEVSFGLGKGERVALIGPNGAGKTTLLKILTGAEEADSGILEKPKTGAALGYLAQVHLAPAERTLFEEALQASPRVLALRHELRGAEEALTHAPPEADLHALSEAYHACLTAYEALDGYAYEGRVGRILKGMGFNETVWDRQLNKLSGGERSQLELAKLLVESPPLLLLDEPTNHLDLEALEWLEEFLQTYPGAILCVTHDRVFLDRVCTRILELAGGKLRAYDGPYDTFLLQKAERILLLEKTRARQEAEIAKLQRFVDRWRYKATKARAAQSRLKMIDRIKLVETEANTNRDLALVFTQAQPSWLKVLEIEGLTKRFGERTLFANLDVTLERGERLAIIGRNGAGKTTLMEILRGTMPPSSGSITWGEQTEVGYFSQTRREFAPNATVFSAVSAGAPHLARQQVAALLGAVGFSGGEWERPMTLCSGGEQSRAALAILLASRANVLLLDEPTNHLDLLARESLEEALEQYPGTIVFISHDRRFIDTLAQKLLIIDGPHTRLVHGNYSHWQWVRSQESEKSSISTTNGPSAPGQRSGKKADRRSEVQTKAKSKFKLEEVIEEIDRLEHAIGDCHNRLADPALHKDFTKVQQVQSQLAALQAELSPWLGRLDEF